MLTDGSSALKTTWKAKEKQRLIDHIVARVRRESPFVEKSEYTIETMRRVLEEEL
jgi:uncharacterized membrane-anchored protein YjiN (DUF445 family)